MPLLNQLLKTWRTRNGEPADPLHHVKQNTLEVRDLTALKRAMGWWHDPQIENVEHLYRFDYLEDLNDRRLRDAEVICAACANDAPKTILEIGTAAGETTTLIAQHAPQAIVHTVNIPPEDIAQGGSAVTYAPDRDEIGKAYREAGCTNVKQILANTATWRPDFGGTETRLDVAFIDGCHDADFVYNDTKKVLAHTRPGSIILWHDFNPLVAHQFGWIHSVCEGVERLYRERLITGRILHLQDSWVGLYRVPDTARNSQAA